ncbi:MFS transporter [Aliamphritea hakodatensis]|uniref:MFS transporter n=1 Tax=Aliamphritea hakodatensis TaxID=2895352 RepID=UPI0022FD76C8|nr:MFS transporter [Aliamphritea hakodatensis]
MHMAFVFGMNQFISHGFGIFLFASLAPLMREEIAFTNWHIAAIGALSQLAYLGGAMLISTLGERIGSARLAMFTASNITLMLFAISVLSDPLLILIALALLSASASISWSTIVEVISRCGPIEKCATYLSAAASGTAWCCSFNGLLLLFIVPQLGWRAGWQIAAAFGICVIIANWLLLRKLGLMGAASRQPATGEQPVKNSLSIPALLNTVMFEPLARFTCLICFCVCFSTIPFANWLNIYLAELSLPGDLGGYTWSAIGLSGMVAGLTVGRLADRFGYQLALLLICGIFALGLMAFLYDQSSFALIAGISYGIMYFPIWGIISGWLSKVYSSTVTMQISSVCMITAGLGGASGNMMVGWVRESSGSLDIAYWVLTANAVLLALLAAGAFFRRHTASLSPAVPTAQH